MGTIALMIPTPVYARVPPRMKKCEVYGRYGGGEERVLVACGAVGRVCVGTGGGWKGGGVGCQANGLDAETKSTCSVTFRTDSGD